MLGKSLGAERVDMDWFLAPPTQQVRWMPPAESALGTRMPRPVGQVTIHNR
jgi:hypothetical protein